MSKQELQAPQVPASPTNKETLPPEVDKDLSFFGGPNPIWTSLDKSKPEERAMILKASRAVELTAESLGNKPFKVAHVLAQKVNLQDADGEITEATRVVLISPDKQAVQFVSEGIKRDMGLIMQLYGKPPYSPALSVKVVPIRTRKGFRMYTLEIV